jgi:hypothetical protein
VSSPNQCADRRRDGGRYRCIFADKAKIDMENGDMNSQRTGLRVASIIFAIFALGHVLRLYKHAKVLIATHQIPMEVSWVVLIIAGALCVWLWRLSSRGA